MTSKQSQLRQHEIKSSLSKVRTAYGRMPYLKDLFESIIGYTLDQFKSFSISDKYYLITDDTKDDPSRVRELLPSDYGEFSILFE